MKIIIVNDFAFVNAGTAQVALLSAGGLVRSGHDVTLFAAVGPFDAQYHLPGLRVICTGQHEIVTDPQRGRAAVQGIWNTYAAHVMAAFLAEMDPCETVIHLHGWTKGLSSSVIRAAVVRGFRVVATLHDYFAACPNGGFFNYQTQEICHLDPLSRQCIQTNCDARSYPQKLWRVARQVVAHRFGLYPRGVRHFITISDVSEAALAPYLPADAVFHRIPNPTAAVQDVPVDAGSNRTFVCVGRLAPEKGVTLLARAAHGTGLPVRFIGDGAERASVEAACPEASISGWVSGGIVTEELRRARTLVLPSLWYEGQPLAVGEAAALGVPAIVPDTCAAREMVVDGKTGLWFRGGSTEDLAEKMKFMRSDAQVQAMGDAAYRQFWRDAYTLERHVGELEKLYDNVLREPTACGPRALT